MRFFFVTNKGTIITYRVVLAVFPVGRAETTLTTKAVTRTVNVFISDRRRKGGGEVVMGKCG